nr:hypothetical protein [Anaerotruncus colihominis]
MIQPFSASSSLFDLMPSPWASIVKLPSVMVTESRPRRPSFAAVTMSVPLSISRLSLLPIALLKLPVTVSVPLPAIVRSSLAKMAASGSSPPSG